MIFYILNRPIYLTIIAGFLTIIFECSFIFSLIISCIENDVSRIILGIITGICALTPFIMQKLFITFEKILILHAKIIWIYCLFICFIASIYLLKSNPNTFIFLIMLCIFSFLFSLSFQIFELEVSNFYLHNNITSNFANLSIQFSMTVGSALGGFLSGQILGTYGIKGIGFLGVLISILSILFIVSYSKILYKTKNKNFFNPPNKISNNEILNPKKVLKTDIFISFSYILLLTASPCILNFLLPWLVIQENTWGPKEFGKLDFLAAFGAAIPIVLYSISTNSILKWIGIFCFFASSIVLLIPNSFLNVGIMCFMRGVGMNLIRIPARKTFLKQFNLLKMPLNGHNV